MVSIIRAVQPLRLLDRRTFTASGTWIKPADYAGNIASGRGAFLRLWLCGGGASGVLQTLTTAAVPPSRGGSVAEKDFDLNEISSSVLVTVGAQTAYGGSAAIFGNPTSFGSYLTASGGNPAPRRITTAGGSNYQNSENGPRAGDCASFFDGAGIMQGFYGAPDTGRGGESGGSNGGDGEAPGGAGGHGVSFNGGRGARGVAVIEVWGH